MGRSTCGLHPGVILSAAPGYSVFSESDRPGHDLYHRQGSAAGGGTMVSGWGREEEVRRREMGERS